MSRSIPWLGLALLSAACGPGDPHGGPPSAEQARVEPASEITDELARQLEDLHAIGYSEGEEPAPAESGAILHRPDLVWPGLNLVSSAHAPEVLLIDLAGQVRHVWHKPAGDIWKRAAKESPPVRRAYLRPGGELLVIYEGIGIARLDAEANVIWQNPIGAHHDLHVLPDESVLVLTRNWSRNPDGRPTLLGAVTELDPEGREMRSIPLLDAIRGTEFDWLLPEEEPAGDLFHANSVQVLEGFGAQRAPAFAKGRLLISLRNLDALVVLDPALERVVWAGRGPFRQQHDARELEDGNLLLFDNLSVPGFSRVLELRPPDLGIVWSYGGNEAQAFRSHRCGLSQRLPNGNTLVVDSRHGRALEVAPDGALVWEYLSPYRVGERDELVARLFQAERVEPDGLDWVPGAR